MDKAFISCRLYSCRRLICTSNMKSGLSSTPSCLRTNRGKLLLFQPLDGHELVRHVLDVRRQRLERGQVGLATPVPMRPAMSRESSGSHKSSQRRCVTPLVTLVKRSG